MLNHAFARILSIGLALAALGAHVDLTVRFKQFKLPNGLTVILSEDHTAPIYCITVAYNVGSSSERPGRAGFAHLFEHLMFQGSENVAKGEQEALVRELGGYIVAATAPDRTIYVETLPANQIDLGLFLEADRMRSLAVTQANLDSQRDAVKEERMRNVENRAYGTSDEAVDDTAYTNFGYRHPVVGWNEDLKTGSLANVREFFERYYPPNNATIAIVGDFKATEVLAKVKKYFGNIPARPTPQPPDRTEGEQVEERRRTLQDPFANVPRIVIAFKTAAGKTADLYAVNAIRVILGAGPSSRLQQRLVRDEQLAVGVSTWVDERSGPGLFKITVNVRTVKDVAAVESVIYEEIAKLQSQPVSDQEVGKVQMWARQQQVEHVESVLNRAVNLAQDAMQFGNADLLNTEYASTVKLGKQDLLRAAKRYLNLNCKTVITTLSGRGGP